MMLTWFAAAGDVIAAEPVVDRSTLHGKVMCGYQGWFNCEGDGAELGWKHWARNANQPFGPDNVTVDLWPDMSGYDRDEQYVTDFELHDGSPATVFSSANPKTVRRHFQWMRDYGIDGAFIQRFANGLGNPRLRRHRTNVLRNSIEAADEMGRAAAVMYDLSGMHRLDQHIQDDWLWLERTLALTANPAYLHHDGKPLVAIWGVGFSDDRQYSLQDCEKLMQWFQQRGCAVMLGIPTYWRDRSQDATDAPRLHPILAQADVLCPWTVGRYRTPAEASRYFAEVVEQDLRWCQDRDVDYLPVIFPGFSWHNLHGGEVNAIPRLKGKFLWSQFNGVKRAGIDMAYVAMFDEVDEGTAIFKCTNQPPRGEGFAMTDYEGLPSDFYLRLVGEAAEMLRGQMTGSRLPSTPPSRRR